MRHTTNAARTLPWGRLMLASAAARLVAVAPAPAADTGRLPSALEALPGTNPNANDSDDDRTIDGFEVLFYGTNPLSTDADNDAAPTRLRLHRPT